MAASHVSLRGHSKIPPEIAAVLFKRDLERKIRMSSSPSIKSTATASDTGTPHSETLCSILHDVDWVSRINSLTVLVKEMLAML